MADASPGATVVIDAIKSACHKIIEVHYYLLCAGICQGEVIGDKMFLSLRREYEEIGFVCQVK